MLLESISYHTSWFLISVANVPVCMLILPNRLSFLLLQELLTCRCKYDQIRCHFHEPSVAFCRVPSPPPAKRARSSENDVSDVLQGEIARLDDRFQVSLDPLQPLGSSNLQLICRLSKRATSLHILTSLS